VTHSDQLAQAHPYAHTRTHTHTHPQRHGQLRACIDSIQTRREKRREWQGRHTSASASGCLLCASVTRIDLEHTRRDLWHGGQAGTVAESDRQTDANRCAGRHTEEQRGGERTIREGVYVCVHLHPVTEGMHARDRTEWRRSDGRRGGCRGRGSVAEMSQKCHCVRHTLNVSSVPHSPHFTPLASASSYLLLLTDPHWRPPIPGLGMDSGVDDLPLRGGS
jgi:hypothetical protein